MCEYITMTNTLRKTNQKWHVKGTWELHSRIRAFNIQLNCEKWPTQRPDLFYIKKKTLFKELKAASYTFFHSYRLGHCNIRSIMMILGYGTTSRISCHVRAPQRKIGRGKRIEMEISRICKTYMLESKLWVDCIWGLLHITGKKV